MKQTVKIRRLLDAWLASSGKTRLLWQVTAVLLAVLIAGGSLFPAVPVEAQTTGLQPKEEVIYAKLRSDGSAESLYVVNSFNLKEAVTLTDFGSYSAVKNLTDSQTLQHQGDQVQMTAGPGRFYYQGNLKTTELPWKFLITYQLDGKAVQAEALSGKSGQLQLNFSVEPNPAVAAVFAENYMLQISVAVDAKRIEQIEAPGAMIANVGDQKQINWMVFPEQNSAYTLTATVRDFAMGGLQIGGVPLNLDFQLPDLTTYTKDFRDLEQGIDELKDATDTLKSGAGDLLEGADETQSGARKLADNGNKLTSGLNKLNSGVRSYADGVGKYVDGVGRLAGGTDSLQSGLKELSSGLGELSSQGDHLTGGSKQIADGLNNLASQLSADGTNTTDQAAQLRELVKGSAAVSEGLKKQAAGLKELHTQLKQINQQLEKAVGQLQDGSQQLPTPQEIIALAGVEDPSSPDVQRLLGLIQKTGQAQAAKIKQLSEALGKLAGGYKQIADGLEKAADGAATISENYLPLHQGLERLVQQIDKLPQLVGGVRQLAERYTNFNKGLADYVGGVKKIATGAPQLGSGLSKIQGGLDQLASEGKKLKSGGQPLADGARESAAGVSAYVDGVKKLRDGLNTFRDGQAKYRDGIAEFADGMDELAQETKGMDKTFEERIQQEFDKWTGREFTLQSFVSGQNTKIQSVQFVFITPEIPEPEKPQVVVEVPRKLNFWEKILDLFGLRRE